ncbi:MAG TPA: prolyl oligopeptidase family serine peptidase [Fimbriimonadaceae bacterium]|nr:prolyl oligopeptidase family serine peptidase [Fimbriimonadaceae bacterium]HRJ95989.1 prolyl oligopeptidase family serine peptidase [Fimbriimonadaceae bacterium]
MLSAFLLTAQLSLPPFGLIREGLTIGPIGRYARTPIQTDPVMAEYVRTGRIEARVGLAVGDRRWEAISVDREGWFQGRALGGGFVAAKVESPRRQVVLLAAAGHSAVWVNGVARPGDPYAYGWLRLPIVLVRGSNDLVFACRRGRLRAEIVPVSNETFLDTADPTSGDFVAGEGEAIWAAISVTNASESFGGKHSLRVQAAGGEATVIAVPTLLPLQSRKVGFRVRPPRRREGTSVPVSLTLERVVDGRRTSVETATTQLRVRTPHQTVKRSFVSRIDGSVQYYAEVPATQPDPKALVLSLHGASVEATSQADAYGPKSWCTIVCPTNRRPFGFDWEEVGRRDALEVLAEAKRRLKPADDEVYLTGHSMGGHGTWHLGVHYPNLFAAIGPSAGWASFFTYGGGARYANPSPVEAILNRAANPSDTLALVRNLAPLGVYILHGDADDNVPVSEARRFADALGGFHTDWRIWEQKGAGHWWESSDEPGAECMDWPPMYDLFARRRLPAAKERRTIDFRTFDLGVSAELGWARIEQQLRPLALSSMSLSADPLIGRIEGATENVRTLRLNLAETGIRAGADLRVVLDQTTLPRLRWPSGGILWLRRTAAGWVVGAPTPAREKNPSRCGLFKDVFQNRVVLVYGTSGTPEENAWTIARARYDSEAFRYIGNGSFDVVADRDFRAERYPDRNVLLYGTAEGNSAWRALLPDSPVRAVLGKVVVGDRSIDGEDLCALFIRPRPDSSTASVGVIAGTGEAGRRMAERMPIFTSGAAFPDVLVVSSSALMEGTRGVRCTGFFGNDWQVPTGDFAFGGG